MPKSFRENWLKFWTLKNQRPFLNKISNIINLILWCMCGSGGLRLKSFGDLEDRCWMLEVLFNYYREKQNYLWQTMMILNGFLSQTFTRSILTAFVHFFKLYSWNNFTMLPYKCKICLYTKVNSLADIASPSRTSLVRYILNVFMFSSSFGINLGVFLNILLYS